MHSLVAGGLSVRGSPVGWYKHAGKLCMYSLKVNNNQYSRANILSALIAGLLIAISLQ